LNINVKLILIHYKHLNASLPPLQNVHQILFTSAGAFTKEVATATWTKWQETIPVAKRIEEPFPFLFNAPLSPLTICNPLTLSTTKKEGINKALIAFVPTPYHAFWQDIITNTNSFITLDQSPSNFSPSAISIYVNIPHPTHPGQASTSTSSSLHTPIIATSTSTPTPTPTTTTTTTSPQSTTQTQTTSSISTTIAIVLTPGSIIEVLARRRTADASM
jgi:hypothetical protein